MRFWAIVFAFTFLFGLCVVGCDEADDDDDSAADDDDDTQGDDDTVPAEATVSGEVQRGWATCPPQYNEVGDMCLWLLTDCEDMTTAVVAGVTPDIDLMYPATPSPFEITNVPDGTFELWGYLDTDGSGCPDEMTSGDLYYAGECVGVTVTDQEDVSGVFLELDSRC